MTRVIARAVWVLAAAAFAILCIPSVAHAQDDTEDDVTYGDAAINIPTSEALEYEGPFTIDSDTEVLGVTVSNDGALVDDSVGRGTAFIVPDVQPGSGTGGGDATEGLALTGSEVEPIVAISVGLLAVGGSALVASRRRLGLFS